MVEKNPHRALLDSAVLRYNTPDFITDDPISIPHRFTRLQDREIVGFWTAMIAWGAAQNHHSERRPAGSADGRCAARFYCQP